MPYLHFDLDTSFQENRKVWELEACYLGNAQKIENFINLVLISQRATKLVRFLLCCGAIDGVFDKMAIFRWIHAATRRNVQQLVLEFSLDEPFELPYCLVTCESLQVLKLHLSGNILKLPNHFGLRHLKLLHLEEVEFSDEHLTSCLFSKCHLLETLILHECSLGAMTLLDITSTSLIYLTVATHCCNVKCYRDCEYVEVYGNCEVKISCPNLKFLKYKASMPKDIIIKNLLSIEDVHIVFTDTIRSVEDTGIFVHKMIKEFPSTSVLKLCTSSISGLYEATSKERLSPISFCKLKSLKLEVGVDEGFMQVMILLLKFSPNLEGLKLCSDENGGWTENRQMHDPDESLACLESHLKSIQLTGFKGEENEIELLRFFLKHARVLEKLMIVWEEGAYKSEEASEKGLYHVARTVRLSPVSFYKLKSLKLEVVIHEESMQVMILLLKYSPNMDVLKLWSDQNVDESVNWQLLDLDESIVCLESHLKSIQLTGFKGEENEIELLKFFLTNARVLEKLMIVSEMDTYKSEEALKEVLKFPRTSSHVVLTFLDAKPEPRSRKWYNSK